MGIWLVSGYDEARAVLAGGDAFSNDLTRIGLAGGHATRRTRSAGSA